MIGDKNSDELASKAANVKFFYISAKISKQSSDCFYSLRECIEFISNSPKYEFCPDFQDWAGRKSLGKVNYYYQKNQFSLKNIEISNPFFLNMNFMDDFGEIK